MRLPIAAALVLVTAPVQALEVTHSYAGRFGVSYAGSNGQGRAEPLYEGRYTLGLAHRTDNGMTFRFELSVIAGNLTDQDRRPPAPLTGAVGIDLQTD